MSVRKKRIFKYLITNEHIVVLAICTILGSFIAVALSIELMIAVKVGVIIGILFYGAAKLNNLVARNDDKYLSEHFGVSAFNYLSGVERMQELIAKTYEGVNLKYSCAGSNVEEVQKVGESLAFLFGRVFNIHSEQVLIKFNRVNGSFLPWLYSLNAIEREHLIRYTY